MRRQSIGQRKRGWSHRGRRRRGLVGVSFCLSKRKKSGMEDPHIPVHFDPCSALNVSGSTRWTDIFFWKCKQLEYTFFRV